MITIKKPNWDEPYENEKVVGDGILVGKSSNGRVVYLSDDIDTPTRNAVAFCGSKAQKTNFIVTNIYNSIIGCKSLVVVSKNIGEEFFDFAKEEGYLIKTFSLTEDSNHWDIFNLLDDKSPETSVDDFIKRICIANELRPSQNQINAFNYLKAVLLYTRYSAKLRLKDVKNYLIHFSDFEELITKLPKDDASRQAFMFAKHASNSLRWDIPSITEILMPFFSKAKVIGSGSMNTNELYNTKCIYIFRPSDSWLIPFILSYINIKDVDLYLDEINMRIPGFEERLVNHTANTVVATTNFSNFKKYDDGILSLFGTKIAYHGCDISAAKYLSELSGISAGNGKLERKLSPQEIVSCGQDNVILFMLSAKTYFNKFLDISFVSDVLKK